MHTRQMRFFTVAGLMLCGAVKPALAEVIVVPTDYPTIQEAVDHAVAGDTVLVLPGLYVDNVVLKQGVNLVGEAGTTVRVNDPQNLGDKNAVNCQGTNTVSGFGYLDGLRGVGLRISGDAVNVFDNGLISRLFLAPVSPQTHVQAVNISRNAIEGLSIESAQNLLIERNLIQGRIAPFTGNYPSIRIAGDSQDIRFYHNTVHAAGLSPNGNVRPLEIVGNAQLIDIHNSIFETDDNGFGRVEDIFVEVTPNPHNIEIWYSAMRVGVDGDPAILRQGNLFGLDPLFVEGHQLGAGSPMIDAGDPTFPNDPDGTRADMGAFPTTQQGMGIALHVAKTPNSVTHKWYPVSLGTAVPNPVVLTSMQTYDEADPAVPRLRNVTADQFEVKIEEEQSQDPEVRHTTEVVGYAVTTAGILYDAGGTAIGEAGSVKHAQLSPDLWHMLNLQLEYKSPVVVMQLASFENAQPAHTRIREAQANSLSFQIEEWDYLDGQHPAEALAYLVVEAGTHLLQTGKLLEARAVPQVNHHWKTVAFSQPLEDPVVLTHIQTHQGASALVSRPRSVTGSTFQVRLQKEEAGDKRYADETVGYIAVER